MSTEAAATDKPSIGRILWVGGSLLFVIAMLAYGIFLPFLECGLIIPDCYFLPLAIYYPMLIVPVSHLFVVWYMTIKEKKNEPGGAKWVSYYHTALLAVTGVFYAIYHVTHVGWHETEPGFSMEYKLLKPYHELLGEELVFPFMLAASLLLFYSSRVKWWLKVIMLLSLAMLILGS